VAENSSPASEAEPGASISVAAGAPDWVRIGIAILIAASSILGAGTAWRASRASIGADERDRAGFARKAVDVGIREAVFGKRVVSASAYLQWLAHERFARALTAEAQHADPVTARLLKAEAVVERSVATAAWKQVDPNARGARAGKLDLDGAARIDSFNRTRSAAVDAQSEFAGADGLRTKAERLVLLAAFLIVAAVAFAIGRVRRRRDYRVWLAIGLIILVGSTIAALYVDIAT
jgi:hypothetical protein